MTDILGEALQKLTTPEQPQAEQSSVPAPAATEIVPVAPPATTQESSTPVPSAKVLEPSPVVDSPATRRSPLQYIQEHRRQAAAIVIAACIAVFWFDDGSNCNSEFER